MLSLLETLGWWGIDFHLPAGVLLLAVTLCSIRVRQPARRRAIGGAVAIGLLLLALLTVLPGWPRMAWRAAPPRVAPPQIAAASPSAGDSNELLTVNSSAMPEWGNHELVPALGQMPLAADGRQTAQADPPGARQQPSAVTPSAANPVKWAALAGSFIVVGAAWAAIWLLLGTVQAARIRRGTQIAGPELNSVLDRIAGAARRRPQLLISGDTTLPLAMGLFRPAIVLPQSCEAAASGADVESAIVHEWAHIRHGDLWQLALLRSLLPLLACQPLFWWLRKIIRTAQEELADAAAADRGGRVAYAEVLLAWARTSPAVLPRGLDGSLALWERPSQLKRRVLTLLDRGFHVELRCSNRRRLAITGLTLVVAGLLSIPSFRTAASAPKSELSPSDDTITVDGRVLADASVRDAKAYLRESPVSWSTSRGDWRPSPTRNLAQTAVESDGRFQFASIKLPETTPHRKTIFPLDVVVIAPGHGIAWRHIAAPPKRPIELKLSDEQSISGRVVERDGRRVGGIRVRVREIADLVDPLHPNLDNAGFLDLESSDVPMAAITGDDGRFALRGLPREIRATLVIDDGRFLPRETYVATTDTPQRELSEILARFGRDQASAPPRSVPVHTGDVEITVERGYRVVGRVTFADTGKPAVGARWINGQNSGSHGITDDDGRFSLSGSEPGTVSMEFTAPRGSGYLGAYASVELLGDAQVFEHTIALSRGETIHGRVIDADSGQGIGGATIWYAGEQPKTQHPQPRVQNVPSAADGSFSLLVPPGKAELIVAGLVPGYITHNRTGSVTWAPAEFHRPINVRAGEPHSDVTFQLRPNPNAALAGSAIDADGQPVENVEILYQGFAEQGGSRVSHPLKRTASDTAGRFVLKDLEPSFQYEVRLIDRVRGLGAYLSLSQLEQPQAPLNVALKPLAVVAGRVVNEEGRPITGAAVRLVARRGYIDGEPVSTDTDGWFELRRLVPGATYSVVTSADGYTSRHEEQFTPASDENKTLADVVLARAELEIAGVLVDEQGTPVAGVQVYAFAELADRQLRAVTKKRLTDNEGRFRLSGLPRGKAMVVQSLDQFGNQHKMLGQVAAGAEDLRLVAREDAFVAGDPRAENQKPFGADDKANAGEPKPPTQPSNKSGGTLRTGADAGDRAAKPSVSANSIGVTRGRVLTPDGKPVSGAKLFLSYPNVAKVQPQLLGESGDDGRFELRVDKSQLDTSYSPDPWPTAALTAVAEGFGFEWVEISKTDANGDLTIKLLQDVPIHGRILTLEGRPVVGAKVKLSTVTAPDGGLDDYIKELRGGLRGDRALQSDRLGRSTFPGMRDTAVTDAEGRFTLAGIGAERVVQMLVTSDEVEHAFLRALTRDIAPIQTGQGTWGGAKIYGATFGFLARPSRTIVGTVREKSGQPLPGISIRSFSGAGLTATTDAQGRYELIGHSKAPQYQVRVIPENMPYFGTMLNIADTPGLDPIVADIELSRGIEVEGRVTAGPNGEPNEATVEYHPLFGNKHVERIGQLPAVNQAAASATCDAEGRYGIPVLPGPGVLTFKYGPWYRQAVARDYLPAWLDREKVGQLYRSLGIEQPETDGNFLRTETGSNRMAIIGLGMYNQALLINPDENEDSLTRDVQLELGRTLNVTIETADGKPPADLTVRGRTNLRFVSEKLEAPEFQVTGLHPKIERELTIEAREQKLGAYRVIHGDEEGPITLRLQPCGAVSGRLLDEDGEPLANTALGVGQVRVMPPEFSATTDKDGKFRLDGLVPGMPYGITLRRQGQMGQGMRQLATDVVVAPGKTMDLGDLDLKPKAMPRPGGFGRVPGAAAGSKPNAAKPATND